MSKRNGDRAKFNRGRQKQLRQRKRSRELRQALVGKPVGGAGLPSVEREDEIVTSRLHLVKGDPAASADGYEVVIYPGPERRQND